MQTYENLNKQAKYKQRRRNQAVQLTRWRVVEGPQVRPREQGRFLWADPGKKHSPGGGTHNTHTHTYRCPSSHENWKDLVSSVCLYISSPRNLLVMTSSSKTISVLCEVNPTSLFCVITSLQYIYDDSNWNRSWCNFWCNFWCKELDFFSQLEDVLLLFPRTILCSA